MKNLNKNLALLLSGQAVSQMGDKFYNIAITFWVFKVTNSSGIMGIVLCSQLVGSTLTGMFAGTIVDSVNRKNILVVTDVIRGLIISLFAILFYSDMFNLALVITVEFLLGVNTAFFNTTVPSMLPQIVAKDELVVANSRSQLISGSMNILGPALAGTVIGIFGYGAAFIINALSFYISAVFELFIDYKHSGKQGVLDIENVRTKLIEGYSYIYRSRQIILIISVVALVHLFYGSIIVVMPVMAKYLSSRDGAELLGYFQTALGVGTIIMSMILGRIKVVRNQQYMFIGFGGIGVMFCLVAGTGAAGNQYIPVLLLCFVLLSGAITLTWINFRVTLQKSIDDAMTGRVFGVVETICNSSIPVPILIFGFCLEYLKFYHVLFVSGLLILASGVIMAKLYFPKINTKERAK